MQNLPVAQCLDALKAALAASPATILTADTGSGKTTWLPLQLLREQWLSGQKIIMLEPRRVAARAAATRLAFHAGDGLGKTVGYSVRFDSKVSNATRLEVVTEGILARRIVNDPELKDIGLIIFDEFHERHIETDLALALTLESQKVFRADLKILVMSATIDTTALSKFFSNAPIITAKGTNFPVETFYHNEQLPTTPRAIAELCARKAIEAHAKHPPGTQYGGDVLLFLPGYSEIQTATQLIEARKLKNTDVLELYGEQSAQEQDRVLKPALPGRRRIIVATSIAESSLTVDGLAVVIDSGLVREPRFDARSGISHLETVYITQDSAVQRAGRAGRLGPGICYRMYHEAEFKRRPKTRVPEILRTDLADASLRTLAFGESLRSLALIDRPSDALLNQAQALLLILGAIDAAGKLTELGRRADTLPLPARLAVMLAAVPNEDTARLAAELSERDELAAERAFLQLSKFATGAPSNAPVAILFAYPDRIAMRKTPGNFIMRGGTGLSVAQSDELFDAEFVVAADITSGEQNARLRKGYSVSREQIFERFAGDLATETVIRTEGDKPRAFRETRLGALVLEAKETQLPEGYAEQANFEKIREIGLERYLSSSAKNFVARVEMLRAAGFALPDFSLETLTRDLENWLLPEDTSAHAIEAALDARLGYTDGQIVARELPEHFAAPSGSLHRVHYAEGKATVSLRIQEVFGLNIQLVFLRGTMPLTFELLSPRGQPIAITNNLPVFWRTTYAEVRKEMRGRYPKHFWPEDPLSMQGTTGTKKAFDRKRTQ